MALPLIVLAIGSVVAGYVGVPHALGGSNRIETFLEPPSRRTARPRRSRRRRTPGRCQVASAKATHAEHDGTELMLMGVSSGVALAGIGIAWYLLAAQPRAADAMAAALRAGVPVLLNKYYVDESTTPPSCSRSRCCRPAGSGRASTPALIDGAVNGVGAGGAATAAACCAALQTGSVRTYAFALFGGVGRDTRRITCSDRTCCFPSSSFFPLAGALLVLLAGGRGDRPERDAARPRPRAADVARDLRRHAVSVVAVRSDQRRRSSSKSSTRGSRRSASSTTSASTASACC